MKDRAFPGPLFLVPRRAKSTNGRCLRTWRRPSATTAARCFTVSPIRDSSVQVAKRPKIKKSRELAAHSATRRIVERSNTSHINPDLSPLLSLPQPLPPPSRSPLPRPPTPSILRHALPQECASHLGRPNFCLDRMIDLTGGPKFRPSRFQPRDIRQRGFSFYVTTRARDIINATRVRYELLRRFTTRVVTADASAKGWLLLLITFAFDGTVKQAAVLQPRF